MPPLNDHAPNAFTSIEFVLTDMDETLTHHGRLAAATYDALERLQVSGIKVIPVTAAPVGWCDQMARMWPVDGVIGENGGLFLDAVPTGYTDWFYESWLSGQGGEAALLQCSWQGCPNFDLPKLHRHVHTATF